MNERGYKIIIEVAANPPDRESLDKFLNDVKASLNQRMFEVQDIIVSEPRCPNCLSVIEKDDDNHDYCSNCGWEIDN